MKMLNCLITFFFLHILNSQPLSDVVTLPYYGKLQGTVVGNTRQFRKIPYAASPVNTLRWAPTVQATPWSDDIYMATVDPPGCPQHCDLPPHGCPTVQDEDCLFLNVFTPQGVDETSKLSVMVFFHGGNFYQGYGGGVLYNGTVLVDDYNIVLVTVNYRLGALGWLWSLTGPNGNYGMLDQRLSLQWVRDNIIYFGGDPSKVTIFGQSAGAMSVALHLVQDYGVPENEKLFQAAIMESNPFALPFRDIVTWGDLPAKFYNEIGCNQSRFDEDLEPFWDCLRSVPVNTIVNAQWTLGNNPTTDLPDHFWDVFLPWTPTMGTDMYPYQAFFEFQEGRYSDVPIIMGTTANESVPFVWGAFPQATNREVFDIVGTVLVGPDIWQGAKNVYPYPDNMTILSDARPWIAPMVTDMLFRCACHNISNVHTDLMNSNSKTNDMYFYHFDHISTFNDALWGINNTECWDSVCHASELPYVFHPNPLVDQTTWGPGESDLSLNMMAYWTNFAINSVPGKGSNTVNSSNAGTEWLSFDQNSEWVLVFQTGELQGYQNLDNDVYCNYWDSTDYTWIK